MDFNNSGPGPGAPFRPPIMPVLVPGRPASPAQSHDSRPSRRSAGKKATKQELYDKWRRLEDKEQQEGTAVPPKKRVKKPKAPAKSPAATPASQLQLSPPLFEAENMSRHASSTGSVTRQFEGTGLQDSPQQQDEARPVKGKRERPLTDVGKARAAFMREAGLTCVNCKKRKVKCGMKKKSDPNRRQPPDPNKPDLECLNAFVFDEFERRYQYELSRERHLQAQQSRQQQQRPLYAPAPILPPHRPSGLSNVRMSDDVLHVGAGQENHPPGTPSGGQDVLRVRPGGYYPDPERILDGARPDLSRLQLDMSLGNLPRQTLPRAVGAPAPPSTVSTRSDVSVGREVDPTHGIWKCNCASCPGGDRPGYQFFQLDQLIDHYDSAHGRFERYDPPESPFRWWCALCGRAVAGPPPATGPPTCRLHHGILLQKEYHGWTAAGVTLLEDDGKVPSADPSGGMPTLNPTGAGQQMRPGARTDNFFLQFLGAGGHGGGYVYGADTPADGDTPASSALARAAPPAAEDSFPCGLAGAATTVSAALCRHALRRPVAGGRSLLQLSALVVLGVALTAVVLPALARHHRLPAPALFPSAHLKRTDLAAERPPPPRPTDCVVLQKPEQPHLADVYCRSERQSHKYEVPLADVELQVQIRVHLGGNCSRRRQRVR